MIETINESRQQPWMGIYLRILALIYAYGAIVHYTNLLGWGELSWTEMPLSWKLGDIFYGMLDPIAVTGLWLKKFWGIACFLMGAISQIVLYAGFSDLFAFTLEQQQTLWSLVIFHSISLTVFVGLVVFKK